MTRDEVSDLLNYLTDTVQNFKVDSIMINTWFNELQQYDIEDVKASLKILMDERRYPTLTDIIKNLTKKYEKVDWNKVETLCQRCNKPVALKDYDAHFDRCSSIDFVIREAKKWAHKDLTRKELWDLSDEAFEKKYNEILHYIESHTKDESEKTRIGFIFSPPSKERAKAFLGEV